MNKHLQQPASMGTPPTAHHSEQLSSTGKNHPSHGPTTQSTFKTDPNLLSQQQTEAKKQQPGNIKKTSGSHPQNECLDGIIGSEVVVLEDAMEIEVVVKVIPGLKHFRGSGLLSPKRLI
ncbi:hypothetical protein BGZ97_002030 [Linnemannia gamsii]|uniref:Uncharacterized protein n=1 Tax=Linnemannia gamsii TaxID=64522 RepID=A0A9P6UU77_9FUNG|nr:hypothetical protein BGZ97_002030 [Linnemannia gamsii]